MQWIARKPNNAGWEMVPPRLASSKLRLQIAPNWSGAVKGGGAIMYFFVREIRADGK